MRKDQIPFEMSPTSSGLLCINLKALAQNWKTLSHFVQPAECGAVVKADAYGLGIKQVMPCLHTAGCNTFFVATPQEAEEARNICPKARIFVLDGLFSGTADFFINRDLIPCLSSIEELKEWSVTACRNKNKLKSCLHIDSGLSRLGLDPKDIMHISQDKSLSKYLDIVLVMSHLASADDPYDPVNAKQLERFENIRKLFPEAQASLAASDGMMLGKLYHHTLVRPGYALYGGQAIKGKSTPVKPVLSLYARILQVRELPEGTSVGYSCSWTAERKSRVAIVALGYADGIPRSLSSTNKLRGGKVRIHGIDCPIVGRVSMDLISVDVTDCQIPVDRGTIAEILSETMTVEDVGLEAGTIGYEILTRLGKRFERVYYGAPSL